MTMLGNEATSRSAERFVDALTYEAPFLIEKLMLERIVETPEEGQALFEEVKRFLVLDRSNPTKGFQMHSLRVDQVWHQFVLFTREYTNFCNQFFGKYIHHMPGNAPKAHHEPSVPTSTFEDFRKSYQEMFGAALPDTWLDEKCITVKRRLIVNDTAGKLSMEAAEPGMVSLVGSGGEVLLSVSDLARDATEFIIRTRSFYVRELPGDLTDDEKVALVATLASCHILRVAP